MKKEATQKRISTKAKLLCVCFTVIAVAASSIWHIPRMLMDTAAVGLDYLTLSHDLRKIPKRQLRADLDAAFENAEHPFVLATKSQFDRVRAEIAKPQGDQYIRDAFAYALEQADCLLSAPPCEYILPDGERLLEVSREVLNRIVTLGFVWQVTGDERYAERGWAELSRVCSFGDWHPAHFLDTAEMTLAVSIGCDWFFDALPDDQKDLLAQTVRDYALTPGDPANPLRFFKNWWSWSKINWNSVCYGALGTACMVFYDRYPDYAAKFLRKAYYSMPAAMTSFRPDGVYAEGNSYWEYGTSYLVYFIATSRNFLGTDYGLSELPGFDGLGHFPLYISTPTGAFNTGDNRSFPPFSPVIFWFASEADEPMLAAYQRLSYSESLPRPKDTPVAGIQTGASEQAREFALSALWCDPDLNGDPGELTLDTSVHLCSDSGQEFVLMRTAYCDPLATYAGIKGGYNYTNHGDLDIGTFVYESRGVRWFEDLGKCDYNSPGYFNGLIGGGRWKNYRKRAEGHNTLVINPAMKLVWEDQYPFARARFSSFEDNTAVLDMTQAYLRHGVKSVTREFSLLPDDAGISVTDRVSCKRPSEIYWFAHTTAEIEISESGKTAALRKDGKTVTARMDVRGDGDGGAVFTVMDAAPLPGSPARHDPEGNIEYKKLTIHIENAASATITVEVTAW
ncbi:MAG: heparinase II/III-family protein [Oscillospiraceae bacterium]|nr:heparinase II/III-family protein [Oscillospiraceae bacterium]